MPRNRSHETWKSRLESKKMVKLRESLASLLLEAGDGACQDLLDELQPLESARAQEWRDKLFTLLDTAFASDQADLIFGASSPTRQTSKICAYNFKSTDLIYRCLFVFCRPNHLGTAGQMTAAVCAPSASTRLTILATTLPFILVATVVAAAIVGLPMPGRSS